MHTTYLYLSLMPESLVASMLPPEEFGRYLAIGTHKRSRGEAMYFDIKPGFKSKVFDLSRIAKECRPHPDGRPKHTLYISIYRALEHVPLDAVNCLHLVTRDGRVLVLNQKPLPTGFDAEKYLYDEICPVHPLIASTLNPVEFCKFITEPGSPLHVPRICFCELDPQPFLQQGGGTCPPPFHHLPSRVQECFDALAGTEKMTKTVDRTHDLICGWLHVKNGYFVGDNSGLLFYPFPSPSALDRDHHEWWRSATL